MAIFTGAGVAIVTPFNEDGSINYDRLDELIEFHCEHKTDSIVICGTTGESATMTEEEHMQCVKFTIDRVNKRVPVIAGTGSNCTRTAIDMSKEASEYGADGLLLVTPYYNKATQNGLIGHFSAVAKEVTAPIIMYSVASRTGCNIEPATAAKLVKEVDNIVGIKEASGNISQVAKIMNLTDGNIDVYSGNDDQIVPVLSLGGKGVISVLSNVAPDEAHDICEKYFNGDVKGSAALQLKALPLIEQLFCEVNPIPVKKAMQLMGVDCGPLRMPLTEISPEHEKNLAQAKDEAGQIVSDARARAKNEYQNKMDQTKEEIALMRENARKDIEAEKQKTIAGLQTEIAGIALMAASKVVEKEANDKGNEKLLDDFLKEAGV